MNESSRFDSSPDENSLSKLHVVSNQQSNDSHCQGCRGQGESLAWILPDQIQSFDTLRVQVVDSRKFPILLSLHENEFEGFRAIPTPSRWRMKEAKHWLAEMELFRYVPDSERGWLEFSSSSPA